MKLGCTVVIVLLLAIANIKGLEYAIGFLNLGSNKWGDIMQSNLLITAGGPVRINVSMNILNQTVKTKEGVYFRFVMNPLWERAKKKEEIEDTAVFMTSEQDFCVHAITLDYESYDGFHPQPITGYSTEFYIPSYQTTGWRSSQFLVVAAEDDTNVNYTIRDPNTGEYGEPKNISNLQRHDKFQVKKKAWDFTGTYVKSDKPIAVFSGVDCGHVPFTGVKYKEKCDHMSVGVPPVGKLGRRYIVAPLVGQEIEEKRDVGYVVRILSVKINTSVTVRQTNSGDSNYVLGRGDFQDLIINSSEILDIQCANPCMVLQYSKSKIHQDDKWDNFMMTVPSLDDYYKKMVWTNPTDRHGLGLISYTTIIAPSGKETGVMIDKDKVPRSSWRKSPGGDYMIATVRRNFGAHKAYHADNNTKIGVMSYGRGRKEVHAFGYRACPAGSNFLSEEDIKDEDEEVYTEEGEDDEPETAASCKAPDTSLWPLWIIICLLCGLLLGIGLGIVAVWLRVRKLKGVPGYIFNPCSSESDDMNVDLVPPKSSEIGESHPRSVHNVFYGVTEERPHVENIYSEPTPPIPEKEPIPDHPEKGVSFA